MSKYKDKIKEIVTYHTEGGTSGYLLDDEQINQLLQLMDDFADEVMGDDLDHPTGSGKVNIVQGIAVNEEKYAQRQRKVELLGGRG